VIPAFKMNGNPVKFPREQLMRRLIVYVIKVSLVALIFSSMALAQGEGKSRTSTPNPLSPKKPSPSIIRHEESAKASSQGLRQGRKSHLFEPRGEELEHDRKSHLFKPRGKELGHGGK